MVWARDVSIWLDVIDDNGTKRFDFYIKNINVSMPETLFRTLVKNTLISKIKDALNEKDWIGKVIAKEMLKLYNNKQLIDLLLLPDNKFATEIDVYCTKLVSD